MTDGTLPSDETESRRLQRRSKELYMRCCNAASTRLKARRCSWRYIKENAVITAAQGLWWQRCSGMGSTGPLLMQMLKI